MLHRSLFYFTLALSILAACDDHKGEEDSTQAMTHPATHSGGDTSGTTAEQPTTSADEDTGTTASATEPPAAPTDLVLNLLEGGVHASWKDASDNEDNFILEKKAAADPDFVVVIELPFDSVTYHDVDVTAATMYTYRVKAVNAAGESLSNEAMIQVP